MFHIAFIKINVPLDIIINDNLIYLENDEEESIIWNWQIAMNPARQRIFQYFLLHETGTVKEIRKALPDIPSASLYRHIKILADSSILMVVGENRIRGTVESVYQLNEVYVRTLWR